MFYRFETIQQFCFQTTYEELKLHYAHKPERGVKGKLKVDHLEEEHDSESSSE